MSISLKDRFLGCLYGLAIGDALGAPVEFMDHDKLIKSVGIGGVSDFISFGELPAGSYSDDTQLSLATAIGLIRAEQGYYKRPYIGIPGAVWEQYRLWHKSQANPTNRREPGNTCMTAIANNRMGTIEAPVNDSKGSGGIMRVAPVGLVSTSQRSFHAGVELSALTHGHPTGYLAAGFLAGLVSELATGKKFLDALAMSQSILRLYNGHEETADKVNSAIELYGLKINPTKAIPAIGKGWLADETLGIAIYCALTFPDDFRSAVLSAVNHSGDRDSCGSVTGAILGTFLGIEGIPPEWVSKIENSSGIRMVANDLYRLFILKEPVPKYDYTAL